MVARPPAVKLYQWVNAPSLCNIKRGRETDNEYRVRIIPCGDACGVYEAIIVACLEILYKTTINFKTSYFVAKIGTGKKQEYQSHSATSGGFV
jgi:hypothetical protein